MTLTPAFLPAMILTFALHEIVTREITASLWLLLYGAGLSACGVFSIRAVLIAGFAFMALGAMAAFAPAGTGVLLLAAGFGGIHIALGLHVRKCHGG